MKKQAQPFDVCVVCALPEEARAFLEVVRWQCERAIEERISPRYHYRYRFATLKNNKDESLNLHISWLPRYGPQEMTLHLSRVLEECQPRIAMMTGICAGDEQQVQLGDLVVAERTFTYDNGKFTLDEHGRSIHLHDTMTYQLDTNILQFLGLFDDWKPLVAHLKLPPSPPEQRKRREIACHIKAMASGSAVRADHPFEDVRAPVRGTVAIDMEGAAFGLVMGRHPLIPWLVVKGVCDYADRDKNDTYHDYAARASALYALSFIRAYVSPGGIGKTQLTIFMNWLNMGLGLAVLMTVFVAIGLDMIAPARLTFTNALGNAAYLVSLLICFSELYVLRAYRQWPWLVGLLVVMAGVYLSNSIFVFGGYMIYLVAAIVPLVFSFGWFFISRRTIAMKP